MSARPSSPRLPAPALALALFAALALAAPARAQIVRAFTTRWSANQAGDITLVGNTLMTCSGGGNCTNGQNGQGGNVNDNDFTMVYVDVDGDATTFNSSSATLALPAGTTVLWAGLYWGGYSNNGQRGNVKFLTPAAGYATVSASQLDANGQAYQGFANVTAQVRAAGSGTYRVANVQSTANTSNVYAGWALVVAYGDPTQPPRNLVVYDGYGTVAGTTAVNITVNGFVTPPAGVVNTRLGVVAYEGDLGFTGDAFQLNGTSLTDANNPANNFFNSSISLLGTRFTAKNPNFPNQLGFDADLVSANGLLPNNATSAAIRLTTNGDTYYPGVVTFATDLYAPVFDAANFTKTVTDLNGGVVRAGDVLEYTLTMKNNGQDNAVACVLRDTLPANATYVPGSLVVLTGANAGAKSDVTGDDQAEYLTASRSVVVRLGTGATATAGGSLAIGASTSVRFRVTVNAGVTGGSTVANQGWLAFTGAQSGTSYTAASDGDPASPGSQFTTVTVSGGITLSGTVYADANHDGARQAGETGTGLALYAKLFAAAGGNALQVVPVSPGTGAYAFGYVSPGTYRVTRDVSADPTVTVPVQPVGWIGTQAPAGVRDNVVVGSADVANQDFGLWQGSSVSGVVFRDDGAGGGTANDGVRQPGEAALAGVSLVLQAACAGACDSTRTDAAGAFTLWLPLAGATGTAVVSETSPAGMLSTGGGAGTTGGTYSRAADAVSFAAATGQAWTGLAFGEVPPGAWVPGGARTVAPGGAAFYTHTYTAGSAGGVSVAVAESPSPALPGWSLELYRDTNCNGAIDPGEPLLLPADVVNLTAGQVMCVVARHTAPAGAPDGAFETATLTASFRYANAGPALTSTGALADVTTVSATGGLVVGKSVDRASAASGDLLTYTITFTNPGTAPLTNLVIRDATPAWTTFDSATCAAAGGGITGCTLAAPAPGATGAVSWTLAGALAPGASGSVSFRVRVQ